MLGAILGGLAGAVGGYVNDKWLGGPSPWDAPVAVNQTSPPSVYGSPEPFEGAPDNPGDAGAYKLVWNPHLDKWVPYKPRRRRRRAMTASDKADFAFLRSQGIAAEKAAGLIMAGVGRSR